MGGKQTGINDDTDVVVLEGASFSSRRVGHTSLRLGIASEAAFRYSRGVDPTLSGLGVDYALFLMREWSGAAIDYKKLSAFNLQPKPQPVLLTKEKLQTYLLWSDMEDSTKILEGYGIRHTKDFKSEGFGENIRAFTPPTWRPDIAIEEDLIEEIGRWRGYDGVPPQLPGVLPRRGDIGAETALAGALRACAIARGYVEAVTYSFLPESFVSMLRLPEGDLRAHPLLLANPISQDWMAMRTTLLPGLLNGLKESVASGWREPVRIFEIGRVFLRDGIRSTEHRELDVLGGLVCRGTAPRTPWPETLDDFLSVKADVLALLQIRGREAAFVQGTEPFGHSGQTARIPGIGYLARLSPAIERELGLVGPVIIFELSLAPLENVEKNAYSPASPFPASFRDISMLVPKDRAQNEIAAEIQASVNELSSTKILESVKLFDIYSGREIPPGYRSMAFSLCYRAFDRTLNDEEVDKIHNSARDALSKKGYNMR